MSLAGSGLKTRLLNLQDELWDRRLGIKTFGYRPARGAEHEPGWQVHYTPANYSNIFQGLELAGANRDDTFTDLGSGMGRAVFAARYKGVKHATGVEILPDLYELAKDNKRISRADGIDFICSDAADVDLRKTTLLYLFHPFGAGTVEKVLQKLKSDHSPKLRIIYVNPVYRGVFNSQGWLSGGEISPAPFHFGPAESYEVGVWRAG